MAHRGIVKLRKVKDQLKSLSVVPSKKRGQNFLIDPFVVHSIVNFAKLTPEVSVVEIGSGLGALTKELSPYERLTMIEIEDSFCQELAEKYPQAKLVNADVRSVEFAQFGENLVVFGNLPYSFSTDIVFHLLSQKDAIDRAILLLQKEFVERMAASPGSRTYGALSVACQLWAKVTLGPVVLGNSFHPPAGVDSQVVELEIFNQPRFAVSNPFLLSRVVQASFTRRRKMIKNSLRASARYLPEKIDEALNDSNIASDRRAETLTIEEFARLTVALEGAALEGAALEGAALEGQ